MNKLYLLVICFAISVVSYSQNRPSVKWEKIETEHFRVIFPQEIEGYAKETAYMMDTIYKKDTKIFLVNHPKKVDLILHNHSVVSNAYAALAPRYMAWYLTPPSSPSVTLSPWNKTLGIHEFRHITQYSVMNQGFTYLASLFFGQYGQVTMQNWSIPNWFYEGDAVFNETKFSNSGRGRMPSFSLPQRTILLNDQKFSYEKALFRSYKDYYPNHYYLGYHIVAKTNTEFGEHIWNKILYRSSLFSFWPYTFERSMKKYTGKNVRKTYRSTYNELDSVWTKQVESLDITDANIINTKKKKVWTNYFEPQIISTDTLLVLKSGFDDNTTMYYLTKDGKEKRIKEISGENISYAADIVVWATYTEHIRYNEESYSDIVVYNLKTKKQKQITKKGKFFSPEVSPDGKKIVAIEFTPDLLAKIVIFDINGQVLNKFEINKDFYPMLPVWTEDQKSIVFLQTSVDGESMNILDVQSGEIKTLIEPQWIKFDKPICYDNFVLFNYDFSGITNIYAIDIKTKEIFQVTSRKFAANQAVVDKISKKIYFTDYNLNGFDIAQMDYNQAEWKKIDSKNAFVFEYFRGKQTDSLIENIDISFAKNVPDTYQPEKYNQLKGLFNFHSWGVNTDGINNYVQLFSDNTINTMSLEASVYGNYYNKTLMSALRLQYKKYFPVFSVSAEGGQKGKIYDNDKVYDSLENWSHKTLNFGINVPLNLSKNIHYRYLDFAFSSAFVNMNNFQGDFYDNLELDYTQLFTYGGSVSFTNRRYMNYRDLLPSFGQTFYFSYDKVPRIFNLRGEQLFASATFYFPGVMKHHGIQIILSYEEKSKSSQTTYDFSEATEMPRGYDYDYYDKMQKLTVEYQLPLFYPDLNIPYLLFVKRVRANIFYDYAYLTKIGQSVYSSTGAEIIFDFNILRLNQFTFNAGLQTSYLIEKEEFKVFPMFMGIAFDLSKILKN